MSIKKFAMFAFALMNVAWIVGLSGCERVVPMLGSEEMPEMPGKVISIGVVLPQTGYLGPGEEVFACQ